MHYWRGKLERISDDLRNILSAKTKPPVMRLGRAVATKLFLNEKPDVASSRLERGSFDFESSWSSRARATVMALGALMQK